MPFATLTVSVWCVIPPPPQDPADAARTKVRLAGARVFVIEKAAVKTDSRLIATRVTARYEQPDYGTAKFRIFYPQGGSINLVVKAQGAGVRGKISSFAFNGDASKNLYLDKEGLEVGTPADVDVTVNNSGSAANGALVTFKRNGVIVEQDCTDGNGKAIFVVNAPNYYEITASHTGDVLSEGHYIEDSADITLNL